MKSKNNTPKHNQKDKNSKKGQGGNNKKAFFIDTIAKYCDKCGHQYSQESVNIVQESNFSSIIHFSCSNCKSNHIATFVRPMGMSSRVPVNCDLTVDEISYFAKEERVTSNEVLEVYDTLEDSDIRFKV